MAGHLNIGLSNMASAAAPKVLLGSVFEVNGGLCKVDADESVGGSPAQGQNYIYAVPNTDGASFQYSATKPVWDGAKGGWYNGTSRAVAKFFYVSSGNQYNNKVILDHYISFFLTNEEQNDLLTSGGLLIASGPVNQNGKFSLEPGLYRYELKGGKGGNGGSNTAGTAGIGAEGQVRSGWARITKNTSVILCTGFDGGNGENTSSYEATGAGMRGADSCIYLITDGSAILDVAMGGVGGGGNGLNGAPSIPIADIEGGEGGAGEGFAVAGSESLTYGKDGYVNKSFSGGKPIIIHKWNYDISAGNPDFFQSYPSYDGKNALVISATGNVLIQGKAGGSPKSTSTGYARVYRIG
jgi:hypothetical protein